jgi:dihydrofolate reductase
MITALFAVDEKGGMGFQGSMPWPRNKEDMIWFKKLTNNHTVVMGKKTWDSGDMPTPLPGRNNILITNTFLPREDIIQMRGDVCMGLQRIQNDYKFENIYIIGGAEILRQTLPIIEEAYITRIPGEYMCDTYIDIDHFLCDFTLIDVDDLKTCKVEHYVL